jgi:hypothetical protein
VGDGISIRLKIRSKPVSDGDAILLIEKIRIHEISRVLTYVQLKRRISLIP